MAETFSSAFDRRRAKRVRPGPLPVSIHAADAVLLDVSETGALIGTSGLTPRETTIAFVLTWREEHVHLYGRIVRRREQQIAVDFQQLPRDSVSQLHRLLQAAH